VPVGKLKEKNMEFFFFILTEERILYTYIVQCVRGGEYGVIGGEEASAR
jgi:hypothetical protein